MDIDAGDRGWCDIYSLELVEVEAKDVSDICLDRVGMTYEQQRFVWVKFRNGGNRVNDSLLHRSHGFSTWERRMRWSSLDKRPLGSFAKRRKFLP